MLSALKARLDSPTSRGLANAVSAAIRDGAIAEGDRLPPIRQVARALNLSPTTVSAAWALLARAGAIRTDGRRGTTIATRGVAGPRRYRRALEHTSGFSLDLSTGVPDPRLLPDLTPALRRLRVASTPSSYLDDPVLPALVDALLSTWPYPADCFTVTDGAMDAVDQICRSLLRFGDRVAVEHPCFPPLLDLLESAGIQIVGVALDEQGPLPEGLASLLTSGISAFFLQPRAQNPTGISMTTERARRLSQLLEATDVLVVEDDSAGAVAGSDAISVGRWLPAQTLHIRSFSKSHGPDLRLAAMSGPARHIDALNERRYLGQGWTSRLLQSLLLDLLTHRPSITKIARARETYATRRETVVAELNRHGLEVGGTDGLNIWVPVRDEAAALVRLASQGIGGAAGSPFAVLADASDHLRITTGLIAQRHATVATQIAEAASIGPLTSPR